LGDPEVSRRPVRQQASIAGTTRNNKSKSTGHIVLRQDDIMIIMQATVSTLVTDSRS
jgi:hypothetical protein